jgi:hypothetical protein
LDSKYAQAVLDRIHGIWFVFIIVGIGWITYLIFDLINAYGAIPLFIYYFTIILWFSVGIILKITEKSVERGLFHAKYIILICAIIAMIWSIISIVFDKFIHNDPFLITYFLPYLGIVWWYSIELLRAAFTLKKYETQIV